MSNERIGLYREAMDLEEKRAALQADIDQITSHLSQLHRQLSSAGGTSTPVKARYRLEGSQRSAPASKKPRAKRKGKRGQLAASILEALKGAGKGGMKLRDLAEQLGVKYANLSVWFSTTGKKNKAIKKLAPGHYRMA